MTDTNHERLPPSPTMESGVAFHAITDFGGARFIGCPRCTNRGVLWMDDPGKWVVCNACDGEGRHPDPRGRKIR